MTVRILHFSDIENAYNDAERLGRLAGSIEALRDERTLVVGTGDDVGPSILSIVTDGRQAIDFFEHVRPDASTFGNHDLDYGIEALLEVVERSPQTWVCANARRNGVAFGADAGIVPSAVVEAGGRRIGVFGLLDPETPAVTPPSVDIEVTDPIEAARDAVDSLRERGVDHVVALAHIQGIDDLARSVDVDVILAGHVHSERIDRVGGTLITRPGAGGRRLVEVTFEDGSWAARTHEVEAGPLDEELETVFEQRLPEEYRRVLADIDRSDAGTAVDGELEDDLPERIVAEAYRWATGADVGIQHSGGINDGSRFAGEVTAADLVGVVPYQDPVVAVSISGDELLNVVRSEDGFGLGGYMSGISVERRDGAVVDVLIGGEPIDPDASYTLATTEFFLESEDGLGSLDGSRRIESTAGSQYDVLIEYVEQVGVDPESISALEV
ncbi:bifunctional metallophosphatase/5'-nucleotidase [Natrarchaeobius chitinivorans]|uniref:Bifunctional metallophosphatase/5'-nucleotidase n=1 Tax=Natrarchaeobius chitinivorans TaxID=1679083 RepID=A0A3N6LW96_NATCH|nr:5'-nucleotidase C-terminal domain-containing protein [Natrarchaeobius chitinivorans]RQG94878.1 bifunctional metallophosphatase/5'-nucleotidase [Natrarchaeobius chitinivorans]